MAGAKVLKILLKDVKGLDTQVVRADEPWLNGPKLINEADAVVLLVSQGARWMQRDPRRYDAFTKLASRGGGITALHWSVGAKDAKYINGQLKLLGGTRGGPKRKYTVVENDVNVVAKNHPVARGVKNFRVRDEFYYRLNLATDQKGFQPLLTTKLDGRQETVSWLWQRSDGGRSFGFVMLHFHKNWELEEYRKLITQGVLWTLKLPIPKQGFNVQIDKKALELPKLRKKSKKKQKNN